MSGNQLLGLLKHLVRGINDPFSCKMLYCSLLRTVLEYASVVLWPWAARPLSRLESIQHKFTCFAQRSLATPRGIRLSLCVTRLRNSQTTQQQRTATVYSWDTRPPDRLAGTTPMLFSLCVVNSMLSVIVANLPCHDLLF